MKVAFLTDTHAGVRNDSDVFADYQQKFYSEIFFPTCVARGIKKVIHGGDYFDRRKFINFKTLERNIEMFVEPLIKNDMVVHMIVGNHDVAYKNTNRLNSPELLLSTFSDNIKCYTEPTPIWFGDDQKPIHLIPWINNENYDKTKTYLDTATPSLVIGHFDIQGFSMHRDGIVSKHGLTVDYFGKHKKILSGHYHTHSEAGKIKYTGNPFEFTWADYNDRRGFWIIDTETFEMEFIENPFHMFYKIEYNSDEPAIPDIENAYVRIIVNSKENAYDYDKWLEMVYAKNPTDVQTIEFLEELSSDMTDEELQQQTKSTDELIVSYIDTSETDDLTETEIDSLKQLMKQLYLESINET